MKAALAFCLFACAALSLKADPAVGIIVTKANPWSPASEIAQVYEYSAIADHTGYLTVTKPTGSAPGIWDFQARVVKKDIEIGQPSALIPQIARD